VEVTSAVMMVKGHSHKSELGGPKSKRRQYSQQGQQLASADRSGVSQPKSSTYLSSFIIVCFAFIQQRTPKRIVAVIVKGMRLLLNH